MPATARLGIAVLAAVLLAAACPPAPSPTPTPDGGEGGAAPVDAGTAFERCVAAKLADPLERNVATKSGTPLATLAARDCSDPIIQGGY